MRLKNSKCYLNLKYGQKKSRNKCGTNVFVFLLALMVFQRMKRTKRLWFFMNVGHIMIFRIKIGIQVF